MANKSALRSLYKEKRNALSNEAWVDLNAALFLRLQSLDIWQKNHYQLFMSIDKNKEVDTAPILHWLRKLEKQVYVPVVNDAELQNCVLEENAILEKNRLGIPEPKICKEKPLALLEVIFIPLLVADKKGNRIGYGGGYYDKMLAKVSEDCLKVGLGLFEPLDEIEEVEAWDIALDYYVCPGAIYSFNS